MDATPGRHTAGFGPESFRGHITNAAGLCLFGSMGAPGGKNYTLELLNTVTGWGLSEADLLKCGERIANMRHVFNLREGINPLNWKVHGRIIGGPPQKEGPLASVTADLVPQVYWCLGALDWDRVTTKPSRNKLLELGLNDIAEELWPPEAMPRFGPP